MILGKMGRGKINILMCVTGPGGGKCKGKGRISWGRHGPGGDFSYGPKIVVILLICLADVIVSPAVNL